MMSILHFIDKFLSTPEAEQFGIWAFGPSYKMIISGLDLLNAWNDRHSDKLKLDHAGEVLVDIEKMVNLWQSRTWAAVK